MADSGDDSSSSDDAPLFARARVLQKQRSSAGNEQPRRRSLVIAPKGDEEGSNRNPESAITRDTANPPPDRKPVPIPPPHPVPVPATKQRRPSKLADLRKLQESGSFTRGRGVSLSKKDVAKFNQRKRERLRHGNRGAQGSVRNVRLPHKNIVVEVPEIGASASSHNTTSC